MDKGRLSVREKIGYVGDAGCGSVLALSCCLLIIFATDILVLLAALVGVLLLSVRVIDALPRPVMGALADHCPK